VSVFFRGEELIAMAVEYEESGYSLYASAAENAAIPDLHALFRELADQEKKHKQTFLRMAVDLPQAFRDKKTVGEEEQGYIRALVESAVWPTDAANIQKAVRAGNKQDVLAYAIGFEKDTMLFFHALLDTVGDSQKILLRAILAEEKTHLRRLTDLKKQNDE